MKWSIERTSGDSSTPLALADIKRHLRLDYDDEDALITAWAIAATAFAEQYAGKFLEGSFRITFDGWPAGAIELPVEPVATVDAVKYVDVDGVQQTLDPSAYQTWLAHSPPLIAPAPETEWPDVQTEALAPVIVEVTAGAAAPPQVKQAILLTLGYWDENRGGEPGNAPTSLGLPAGAKRLLDSIRTGSYR